MTETPPNDQPNSSFIYLKQIQIAQLKQAQEKKSRKPERISVSGYIKKPSMHSFLMETL